MEQSLFEKLTDDDQEIFPFYGTLKLSYWPYKSEPDVLCAGLKSRSSSPGRVKTGSGVHPASNPVSTVSSFSTNKAAGALSSPRGKVNVVLYIRHPTRYHCVILSTVR